MQSESSETIVAGANGHRAGHPFIRDLSGHNAVEMKARVGEVVHRLALEWTGPEPASIGGIRWLVLLY